MDTAKINADGNLVINPLELLAMQQEFDNYRELTNMLEHNLTDQITTLKGAFAQLWEEVGTAALTGNMGEVLDVLNRSMVFYDQAIGRKED